MTQKPDRLTALHRIREVVGDRSEDGKLARTEVFCIEDGEPIPPENWQPERYRHRDPWDRRSPLMRPR